MRKLTVMSEVRIESGNANFDFMAGRHVGYSKGVSALVDVFLSWLYEEKESGKTIFGFEELVRKVYSFLGELDPTEDEKYVREAEEIIARLKLR